jgi:excisionase family DNA binding protein
MKAATQPADAAVDPVTPALTVKVQIDPLVEVVRRHVKLSAEAARLIKGDFARLFQHPAVVSHTSKPGTESKAMTDEVLSTQEAAELVGVSRPYLVARIEAGDIPLHQQVGKQRRVLKSAVQAWHVSEQTRRREALVRLVDELDEEIFPGQ